MKKQIAALMLAIMLFLTLSLPVSADTAPKPSVKVRIEGIDEPCYGTLLSKTESTGPASVWNGEDAYDDYMLQLYGEEGRPIWEKFVAYEDEDGFFFLQQWWECSENQGIEWTYYPPSTFKLLLYFAESDRFAVGPVCERYAFDSYFTATLTDGGLAITPSYDYSAELSSFVKRVALTILLELILALIFGYFRPSPLLLIAGVNIFTQIGLNVALNLAYYYNGRVQYLFMFLVLEPIVTFIEAIIYEIFLPRLSDHTSGRALAYALCANIASCVAGVLLSDSLPGMF